MDNHTNSKVLNQIYIDHGYKFSNCQTLNLSTSQLHNQTSSTHILQNDGSSPQFSLNYEPLGIPNMKTSPRSLHKQFPIFTGVIPNASNSPKMC